MNLHEAILVLSLLVSTPLYCEKDFDMTIPRSEQLLENSWDLSPLYPHFSAWNEDFQKESQVDYELLFAPYKAKDSFSPQDVRELLELSYTLDRHLSRLYTWAHLTHDQDIANDDNKQTIQSVVARFHALDEATSWIHPKILEHSQEELAHFADHELLEPYKIVLERMVRLKPYTLSIEQEALVAMSQKAMGTSHNAFENMNNADFRFLDVKDKNGDLHPLTHASYSIIMKSDDRIVRENAFLTMHAKYKHYENTICELLQGAAQSHFFNAKSHKFSSCLEAALWPKDIPVSVYHSLIETVRANISKLHKYISLKKKFLNVDTLHAWDLYTPLIQEEKPTYSYEEAVELIQEACLPLGLEYVEKLKKGITTDHWVDKYENQNKRSGAYSSGCYDSPPYILLNYKNQLRDVSTLAHEAGHSMHSELSKKQPFQYSHYPIFVAEVASTFNEELLSRTLLQKAENNKRLKASLINEKLEDLRATLFRQTMFAEFELFIHERVENDLPVTPKILNDTYQELNKFYFGNDLLVDEELSLEWARIPHFYYNFYVYQYATGISAAHALAEKVLSGGEKERKEYLDFLQGGCSLFPIDLLKKAGVDMTTGEAIENSIQHFGDLVEELSVLLTNLST